MLSLQGRFKERHVTSCVLQLTNIVSQLVSPVDETKNISVIRMCEGKSR